jgi:hypothetical protein
MKKSNCTPEEVFNKLPCIPEEDWKFLWEDDCWDGPVSGMLEYKDDMFYFMLHRDGDYDEETDTWSPRTYTVHRLTPEILQLEIKWHKLFQELVGKHSDYKEGKHEEVFSPENHPNWREFYDKRKAEYDPIEPDLDDPHVANLIARIQL